MKFLMSADGNIVHFYHTYRAKICVYLPWFLDLLCAWRCSKYVLPSRVILTTLKVFCFYIKGFFKIAAFCSYSVGEIPAGNYSYKSWFSHSLTVLGLQVPSSMSIDTWILNSSFVCLVWQSPVQYLTLPAVFKILAILRPLFIISYLTDISLYLNG